MIELDRLLAQAEAQQNLDEWEVLNKYRREVTYVDDDGYVNIVGRKIDTVRENISVQGEQYSQYIEFLMDRFYDGVDLAEQTLAIHYEVEGNGGEDAPINVYKNSTQLKFGWLIGPNVAQYAQPVEFCIWVRGTLINGNKYVLKTLPQIYTPKRGLVLGGGIPKPDNNWYLQFSLSMDEKVNQSALNASQAAISADKAKTAEIVVLQAQQEVSQKSEVVDTQYKEIKIMHQESKQYRDEAEQFRNQAEQFTPDDYSGLVGQVNKNTVAINTIVEKSDLGIKETASGEYIHLDDSADSKLVEFAMYGKATQNGEPTPQNPVEIEVAGESYNLIPYPYEITTMTVNGITWTDLGDGRIMANGTATETSSFDNFLGNQTEGLREKLQSYGEVILTGCPSGGGSSTYRLFVWGAYNDGAYSANDYGSGAIFTFNNNNKAFGFSAQIIKGVKVENLIFKPMLRKASVKNDRYMPYGKGSVEAKSVGKNLLPYPYDETTNEESGVTWTDNNGIITTKGTATAMNDFLFISSSTPKLLKKGTYILSGCPSGGELDKTYFLLLGKVVNGKASRIVSDTGNGATFTLNEDTTIYLVARFIAGTNAEGFTFKPMIRLATDTDDTWQPYKETLSTILTENGLAGIPVDSGGNYTDQSGQQWICDEVVKYADGGGEYVQRIEKKVFDGVNNVCTWVSNSVNNGTLRQMNLGNKASMPNSVFIESKYILCDKFKPFKFNNVNDNFAYGCRQGNTSSICCLLKESDGVTDVTSANEWLKNNNVKVYYIINPIRTPLTAEQLAEIEKLSTFYPVTNISNDFDCGMKVTYVVDAKTYIDNKLAQIAAAVVNSI